MCVNKDAVVLVIDDCKDNLFLMELVLANGGYKVVTACNGKEGITKATELSPSLIVLDMMMPDMSGAEVIKRMKASRKLAEIPIILCTANRRILKKDIKGIVDICYKPFDIDDMITRVNSSLKCCQDNHSPSALADRSQTNPISKPQQWQSVSKAWSFALNPLIHQEVLVFQV